MLKFNKKITLVIDCQRKCINGILEFVISSDVCKKRSYYVCGALTDSCYVKTANKNKICFIKCN